MSSNEIRFYRKKDNIQNSISISCELLTLFFYSAVMFYFDIFSIYVYYIYNKSLVYSDKIIKLYLIVSGNDLKCEDSPVLLSNIQGEDRGINVTKIITEGQQ